MLSPSSRQKLIKTDATGVLSEVWATVEDSDDLDNFKPHVVHKPHDPFPIAMCCRKPHGCESLAGLFDIGLVLLVRFQTLTDG